MRIHKNHLTNMPAENMNQGRQMTKIRRDRTQAKYKALDMTELSLKVAIKAIDHHTGRIREGTSRPDKRIHDHSSGKLCHADRTGDCRSGTGDNHQC